MLKEAAKDLFNNWLIFESNHTNEIKEKILQNIEKNIDNIN